MSPKNVLYIEDNPDNLTLVRRAVESMGYAFTGASGGEDGLRVVEEMRPDLVLLDMHLPDIDGFEVARRLRARPEKYFMYLPIIAITGNTMKGGAERVLESGCDVFLPKPINIRELWSRLETYLDY